MRRLLTLALLLGVGGCLQSGDVLQRISDSGAGTSSTTTAGPGSSGNVESTGVVSDCDADWCPTPGVAWQKQLNGELDFSVDAEVVDIRLFATSNSDVETFKNGGARVICYLDVGQIGPGDPDRDSFPADTLGALVDGGPDQWLDFRPTEVRELIAARFGTATAQGCDAVEFGRVDGYQQNTGFALTRDDQVGYLHDLAEKAHLKGLAIAAQDAQDLTPDLVDEYDFAVNRGCIEDGTCDVYAPYIAAGKAVFHLEFVEDPNDAEILAPTYCPDSAARSFSTIFKKTALNSWLYPCP